MEATLQRYRTCFGNPVFMRSVVQGAAFLAASMIAIFAAVTYATVNASNHVTDIFLDNLGPYNTRFLFIYGTFAEFIIAGALLGARPNRLPFVLKTVALFLLVRAVFVSLTHIAPSPIDPQAPAPFFNSIFYGSDQFFSGHTGMPFLAALMFWHMLHWRLFFLASTAFFAAIVLLGHYHYSIDVLAALFITHGIFRMSCWLFRSDYTLLRSSEAVPVERRARKGIRKRIDKWVDDKRRKPAGAPPVPTDPPGAVPVGPPGAASEPFVLHVVADEQASPPPAVKRERLN